jgi:hypothetical protein
MSGRLPLYWLPRLLFRLALALSLLLILLVALAPLADPGAAVPPGWRGVFTLFARDQALRRTTVACAVGLAVTACIFFRPPERPQPRRRRRTTPPPPPSVAGA